MLERLPNNYLIYVRVFSPLIANEIVNRRQFMTQTLPDAFDEVMTETKISTYPCLHKNHETGKEDFYFMKLNQFYDDIVEYHSLHELLIAFMMHVRERKSQTTCK